MKKLILLISCAIISSCCSKQKILEAKAKRQAESANRLNQSQNNTQGLFDEIK